MPPRDAALTRPYAALVAYKPDLVLYTGDTKFEASHLVPALAMHFTASGCEATRKQLAPSDWALVSPGARTPERLFRGRSCQQFVSLPGRVVRASHGHLGLDAAEGDATHANAGLRAALSS